jgi:hypothetical protein
MECGLLADGESNCHTMRDELLARDYEQVVYWRYHRIAVDAYCLQHPADYCASTKSLAAHLCGLCVAFERGNDEATLRGVQQWLSLNPQLPKPELPKCRGELTIANVHGISDPFEYGRAVDRWARSVWDAYSSLHAVAREWLAKSKMRR